MFGKEINFDRFVRGLIFMTVLVAGYFLVCYLSPVLVPFVVAWAFAYILYPVVNFFQYKCRFHFRMLSILVTLVIVIGIISTLLYLAIPVMLEELLHLKDVAIAYVSGGTGADSLPEVVQKFIRENSEKLRIERLLNEKDLMSGLKEALPRVWNMLLSTANVLISIVSSLIALLYLFSHASFAFRHEPYPSLLYAVVVVEHENKIEQRYERRNYAYKQKKHG